MKKIFILIFGLFLYSTLFAKQNVINITTDNYNVHNVVIIRTLQNTLYKELKKLSLEGHEVIQVIPTIADGCVIGYVIIYNEVEK